MEKIDDAWSNIIELLQVPNQAGLFILGCFARRVTIYSQQVRAINLIDALAGQGYLTPASKVAVVGAGFSGLTAAAALTKLGIRPTLYDTQTASMHLQRSCVTRYIHPHIYDWPSEDINKIQASLPVLDWSANGSKNVVLEVQRDWDQHYKGKVSERLGKKVRDILVQGQQWQVVIEDGTSDTFDIIILAVGFGAEAEAKFSTTYWGDLPLEAAQVQEQTWMVSGAGDGALTDVIRLCMRHTDHKEALHSVVEELRKLDEKKLNDLCQQASVGIYGTKLFDTIDYDALTQHLDLRPTKIILNATQDELFGTEDEGPRASLLNRLVVWLLCKKERVELLGGRLDATSIKEIGNGDSYEVTVSGSSDPISCHRILLRHGPVAPIQTRKSGHSSININCPPSDLTSLHNKWKVLYKNRQSDPTLIIDWPSDMLSSARITPDFNSFPALWLYSKTKFPNRSDVNPPLRAFKAMFKDEGIQLHLKTFCGRQVQIAGSMPTLAFEDAVATPRMLSHAVQAICRAPVVIVDGSPIAPALAFLLGIRAVVRRGITLVYHQGTMGEVAWKSMPFNLREARIVEIGNNYSVVDFQQPLTAVLEEGLRRFSIHPQLYSDLPGFDTLRSLGGDTKDISARSGTTEILVLCPFDGKYKQNCWVELQRVVQEYFPNSKFPDGPAKRVIDLDAPEMLVRRLFESIRLDEVCIADLTNNRANVYFELGVRLAAHPNGAYTIHCCDTEFSQDGSTEEALRQLLGSRPYSVDADSSAGINEALTSITSRPAHPNGAPKVGLVFSIVVRNIEIQQEAGGTSILDMLWNNVSSAGGTDMSKWTVLPVMYQQNTQINSNTLRFIADGLIAYALLARHNGLTQATDERLASAIYCLDNLKEERALSAETKQKIVELLALIPS
ncbi:NAD(P)-binding protein [Duganella sacchari]|nr:NAD(P)-binding protein [Duganella sacchari]